MDDDEQPPPIAKGERDAAGGRCGSDGAAGARKQVDANNILYQFEASGDYKPEPHLGEIKAQLWTIDSADDEVNPPELGQVAREIDSRVRGADALTGAMRRY